MREPLTIRMTADADTPYGPKVARDVVTMTGHRARSLIARGVAVETATVEPGERAVAPAVKPKRAPKASAKPAEA